MLATSIAETSLTIEGVRVVVDTGLSRVPRYDRCRIDAARNRRVSRAAADQRRGRAGRTEPGVCSGSGTSRRPRPGGLHTPEILAADLSPLVLDLAQWGVADPARCRSSIRRPRPR